MTQPSDAVWVATACRGREETEAREDNGWMAMRSPFIIALTTLDESVLHARARSPKSAHRDVIRARIVLAAADGRDEHRDRRRGGCACRHRPQVASPVRRRWPARARRPAAQRAASVFTPVQVAEVKALACTLPAETGAAVVAVVER